MTKIHKDDLNKIEILFHSLLRMSCAVLCVVDYAVGFAIYFSHSNENENTIFALFVSSIGDVVVAVLVV